MGVLGSAVPFRSSELNSSWLGAIFAGGNQKRQVRATETAPPAGHGWSLFRASPGGRGHVLRDAQRLSQRSSLLGRDYRGVLDPRQERGAVLLELESQASSTLGAPGHRVVLYQRTPPRFTMVPMDGAHSPPSFSDSGRPLSYCGDSLNRGKGLGWKLHEEQVPHHFTYLMAHP